MHFAPLNLPSLATLTTLMIVAVPYMTAVLTHAHLPRWANELIALAVSLLAGLMTFLSSGGDFRTVHDANTLLAVWAVIFAGAKLYYQRLRTASPLLTDFKTPAGNLPDPIGSPTIGSPTIGYAVAAQQQALIQEAGAIKGFAAAKPSDAQTAIVAALPQIMELLSEHTAKTTAAVVNAAQEINRTQGLDRSQLAAPPAPDQVPPAQAQTETVTPTPMEVPGGSPDGSGAPSDQPSLLAKINAVVAGFLPGVKTEEVKMEEVKTEGSAPPIKPYSEPSIFPIVTGEAGNQEVAS